MVYECLRLLCLGGALWIMGPAARLDIPALTVYAAPGALFPLMALFFWLDPSRYAAYVPLYIAGKVVGVCAGLGWLIAVRLNIIDVSLPFGAALFTRWSIPEAMLCGDMFSAAAAVYINKKHGG